MHRTHVRAVITALVLAAWVIPAGTAPAGDPEPCAFDPASGVLSLVVAPGDGSDPSILSVDGRGVINVGDMPCAPRDQVERIVVSGSRTTDGPLQTLRVLVGINRFVNARGEIPIDVDLGTGSPDRIEIVGGSSPVEIEARANGANLNAGEHHPDLDIRWVNMQDEHRYGDDCDCAVEDLVRIEGGVGEDRLASDGWDVDGGEGRDHITLADRDLTYRPTAVGGLGNDVLRSVTGGTTIFGEEGDDRILGSDNSADGSGWEYTKGGPGSDVIDGGPGPDRIDGAGGAFASGVIDGADLLDGGGGRDHLSGHAGDDRLDGGSGPDRYQGGLGIDRCERDRIDTSRGGCELP